MNRVVSLNASPEMPASPANLPSLLKPDLPFTLLLWLLIQLIAISLAAARVPLWAKFPQPGEMLALTFLVTAQLGAASLCLPFLLGDARRAACVIATGWPLAIVAGALSAESLARTAAVELFVSGTLAVGALWANTARGLATERIITAIAALWTVGGAILVYLRAEFMPASTQLIGSATGPLVAAVRLVTSSNSLPVDLLLALGSLAIVGGSLLIARRVITTKTPRATAKCASTSAESLLHYSPPMFPREKRE